MTALVLGIGGFRIWAARKAKILSASTIPVNGFIQYLNPPGQKWGQHPTQD